MPPIKGIDKQGVFNFITLDDARAIDSFLSGVRRAVVIGGGLIGLSVIPGGSKATARFRREKLPDEAMREQMRRHWKGALGSL